MDSEDRLIVRQFGRQQPPFKVPEGYFENFPGRLMERLPEHEAQVVGMRRTHARLLRPLLLAAASVAVAIFTITVWFNHSEEQNPQHVSLQSADTYNAIDEMADYTMMDNQDMYAYVSMDY